MAKSLALRFLDTSDEDKFQYITIWLQGERRGLFKRDSKELIDDSAEGTTCRIQKKLFTEVRLLGHGWRQLDFPKFKKMLNEINAVRLLKGWEPVFFPYAKEVTINTKDLLMKHSM